MTKEQLIALDPKKVSEDFEQTLDILLGNPVLRKAFIYEATQLAKSNPEEARKIFTPGNLTKLMGLKAKFQTNPLAAIPEVVKILG